MSWRDPPEPINEALITERRSCDLVVVGLGYAGSAAARAAAESGAQVVGLELTPRERYNSFGRDVGHINSRFLASRGVPAVDPIDLYNEWMKRAGNRANPGLVMKYCQNCGEAFDWYTDMYTLEELADLHVAFWPHGGEHFVAEAKDGGYSLNGYRFWPGTAEFPDPMGWPGAPTLQDCSRANLAKAEAAGATLCFGREAVQLIRENGRVAGVIAHEKSGEYYEYRAEKGVILSAGDFAGDREMLSELCCDIRDMLLPEQKLPPNFGRRGQGIRMGVWAGGRLEARPLPTMGGNMLSVFSPCGFGCVWLDSRGKRFCNEVFGGTELAGFAGNQGAHGDVYCVFDEHCLENELAWSFPAHGGFDGNNAAASAQLREIFEAARTPGTKRVISHTLPPVREEVEIFVGRTPEELAENAGLPAEETKNVVESLRRYNELCRKGRDDDFGRDPKVLDPLTGMLFLHRVRAMPSGGMLVSVGGLVTDEEQRVLDENYRIIDGLYASGNCCGRRFGTQYSTPIAGVSIGMAITLGREVGRFAAS